MKKYVLGFAFWGPYVVLIKKTHPDWQKGCLNGLGGHIQPGETPLVAMTREFQEECGVVTHPDDWKHYCTMQHISSDLKHDWICYCFKANIPNVAANIQTTTDEEVFAIHLNGLDGNKQISNVGWLIKLALDRNAPANVVINY